MLWSLLKVIVFLAIAVALAFGAAWLLESPGEVRIAFAGREFALTPIGFVIAMALFLVAALIVLKVIGFLGAVMRFLLGDETAISRYFSRARERRGFDALSDSMVALAEGDPRLATKKAATAEKLLRRPEVTRLLGAQAAELSGDDRKAQAYYKSML
ncbi:MAG TPA: heme biosynthesis HemY N-terminal domain-containing protein, partial [Amaricoccus sp.]|nr:heme biosynthesis HemY N-terminal domain-containing protein [Amaricoccus sp.]